MPRARDERVVEIFTDGACSGNPGPGGWGAILRWGDSDRELSGAEAATTNNRMDADKKPVKNVDLWQRLLAAVAAHDVEWRWVRGHSGHPENERADALARAAIKALREAATA
ncbi:MAG: hypothetical protein HY246_16710 [Proteobacteria bacterium]|nr:hypothetical protein [Pseudomonadota bacterium]